jgi:hypothetical protein
MKILFLIQVTAAIVMVVVVVDTDIDQILISL